MAKEMHHLNVGDQSFEIVDATARRDVAAESSRIDQYLENHNTIETELWTGAAKITNTVMNLSDDVSNFDYIDVYCTFFGRSQIFTFSTEDISDIHIRIENLPDDASSQGLGITEFKVQVIDDVMTLLSHTRFYWNFANGTSFPTVTNAVAGDDSGDIIKVVGRKIVTNDEVADIRVGTDGTTYSSAGVAVRTQINALSDEITNSIGSAESAAEAAQEAAEEARNFAEARFETDPTLSAHGIAADAKATGDAIDVLNNGGLILKDDVIQSEIDNWLDEHPDATTTVQNHSLNSNKFSDKVPFYNVQDYGVLPNSGDIYDALHALISNYVYYTGGIVFFPEGKYTISNTIFIPEGTTFIGIGDESEIYFDETVLRFGTALTNAGSNVKICNLKISQKTKSGFGTGSRPGCIGFSTYAKINAFEYTGERENVHDLMAENILFDGSYAIQTENDNEHTITNVTYYNLRADAACVSINAKNVIKNVNIDNCTCDFLRILASHWDTSSAVDPNPLAQLSNITIRNFSCATYTLGNQNFFIHKNNPDDSIVFENFTQKDTTRNIAYIPSTYSGRINANVLFINSTFNSLPSETNGISLYYGIRKFEHCVFNMSDRISVRSIGIEDTTNYEIINNSIFNSSGATANALIGYGRNNTYNATNILNYLWGDMHREINLTGDTGSIAIGNRLRVDGENVWLLLFGTYTSISSIFTLDSKAASLPAFWGQIPCTLLNRQTPTTNIAAFVKIDSETRVASVTLEAIASSTAFNRYLVNTPLVLTRKPTPSELFAAF